MKFAFVHSWRHRWPVELLCRVMLVSERGYRSWRSRPISCRERTDMKVLAHMRRRLHATSPPPRADRMLIAQSWRELNRIGINLNQAVHALHAATMVDSRLDLAREAARVASFRDEVTDQLRALGRALKGDMAYWDTADE